MKTYEQYRSELLSDPDLKYNAFNSPIVNCEYKTYGVRTPVIKKLANSVPLAERDAVLDGFYSDADLTYETVLFAACAACKKGDYEKTREHLRKIIPMFASWAHVDVTAPCLKWVDKKRFLDDFRYLLDCDGQYERRMYVIFMLSNCMTDELIDFVVDTVKTVRLGEYYVDMAVAWLVCEGLIKHYEKFMPLIENKTFSAFVHNKAIQKARESFRVSEERKALLAALKIKHA